MTHLSLIFVSLIIYIFIRGSVSFLVRTDVLPKTVSEDARLNFTGLSIKYGIPAEEYQVITEDGYQLTVYHIPGKACPVLIVHGISDSSDNFIIKGKDSMAVTLATAGYDLWFANMRGNRYSRRHIHLNPDTDPEFWNFSMHELGYYDLPATIDFILERTGRKQLMAIGHSQGNALFYVLGSTRPEYNEKVKVLIALAPVCYLNNIRPPIDTLAALGPVMNDLLLTLGIEELLSRELKTLIKLVCIGQRIQKEICSAGFQFLAGWDPKEFDPDFVDVIVAHYPTGTSRQNAFHFSQIARAKRFQQFDYGVEGNLRVYKSRTPPKYDLSKVTMNVELFTGRNDKIATVEDVKILREKLPNNVYRLLNNKNMNHMDFVWGNNMNKYLFPPVLEVLRRNCNFGY